MAAEVAVFSLVRAVLLRPLPYENPESLVFLWLDNPRTPEPERLVVTGEHVWAWRNLSTFEELAALKLWDANLDARFDWVSPDGAVRLRGALATPNVFRVLGIEPVLGRTFADIEQFGEQAVVLSDHAWRRWFRADPAILGSTIRLKTRDDTRPAVYEIVGVLPRGVRVTYPSDVELWTLLPWEQLSPTRALGYQVVGRLNTQATPAEAEAELNSISSATGQAQERRTSVNAMPSKIIAEPVAEYLTARSKRGIIALVFVALLVFVSACVGLGLIIATRTVERRRELGIRMAVGAAPSDVLKELTLEALVVALGGTIGGLVVAQLCLPLLARNVPPVFSRGDEVQLDLPTMAFAFAAYIVIVLSSWVGPSVRVARTAASIGELRAANTRRCDFGAITGGTQLVVAAGVAVLMTLLVTSLLLLHSLWRAGQVNLGFRSEDVLTVELRLLSTKYRDPTRARMFEAEVLSAVRALPNVSEAAATTAIPMQGVDFAWVINSSDGVRHRVNMRAVDADYFFLLRVPLIHGRLFSKHDTADSPRVAIVSESLAGGLFNGESAVGRMLELQEPTEIVGVIADARFRSPITPATPGLYLPREQQPSELVCLLVRLKTKSERDDVATQIRQVVGRVDPDQPVEKVSMLDDVVAGTLIETRFIAGCATMFAVLAVLIAVLALFGIVSLKVIESRRAIAIRIALGASRGHIVWQALSDVGFAVVLGTLVGCVASSTLTSLVQSFLFETAADEPWIYLTCTTVVAVVVAAASVRPLLAAVHIEPMSILRSDT